MKQLLLLSGVMTLSTGCWLAPAQIVGSGNVVNKLYDVGDFDQLQVGHSFHVELRQGTEYSVEIQADDNVIPDVEVAQVGRELQLGMNSGFQRLRNVTLKALITMPEARRLEASGASKIVIDRIVTSSPISLRASGASHISGIVEGDTLEIDASGASDVKLVGSANVLELRATGASQAELNELRAAQASVEASGASTATISVSHRLDAEASGASHVTYGGNPELTEIRASGASSVKRRSTESSSTAL